MIGLSGSRYWNSPATDWGISEWYSPGFKTADVAKNIWRITNTIASIWRKNITIIAAIWQENMLGYLFADIVCSEKGTVFRERRSRKTVSFEEQIMSKNKYPSTVSMSNGGYCVYYPLNIFLNTRDLEIGECSRISPSFSQGIGSLGTRGFEMRMATGSELIHFWLALTQPHSHR